jgi:hypothetical protein
MGITIELMNEVPIERGAILTIEYEYIPTLTTEFRQLDALWLDVTGVCGDSGISIPPGKDVFEFHTPDVKVNTSGTIIAAGGHLHDGKALVHCLNIILICI